MKNLFVIILFCITITLIFLFTGRTFADGFIVVPRPVVNQQHTTPFPLEVKYHRVSTDIKEQNAETFIDQEFYNPTGARLEGFYIFPIPENAVIKKFTMFINGIETEAELLDAKKAREIYEEIVRKTLDPALFEYQGRGIFKVRIFPIEPYSAKRIRISYNQVLEKDNGTIEYIYPLNTEKFSSKALKEVAINVSIKSDANLKNIYCTTHNTDLSRKSDHNAVVSYSRKDVKPDADFKLYYNTDKSRIGLSALSYREKGNDGFFFLSISPGFDDIKSEVNEKDITFVLDISGSMAGEKLGQAMKAMLFCINNLNKGDHFQIIRFGTEAEALFNGLSAADYDSIQKAKKFINDMKAIGGTNIEEALTLALKGENSKRPHMIVFITDGMPTIGETGEDKLLKKIKDANRSNTRIFTFGVGYEINTHLLDRITMETRAYRYYISPEEDIEEKISGFYSKIQSPVLSDLRLSFSNDIKAYKVYPKDLPDVFKGSAITIIGKYSGRGDTKIMLEGIFGNKVHKYEYRAVFEEEEEKKNDFIPYIWAARHVGYLLDQVRLNGEDRELIQEITETSRRYGIVTPYTSYLILEDERARVSSGNLRPGDQTMGNIAPPEHYLAKKTEMEYRGMMQKSGAPSVYSSREFQSLNRAGSMDDTRQGKSRLDFKDSSGKAQNVNEKVKNILGRAVYNTGGIWIDSMIQGKNGSKHLRIKFAGKEYFDLLNRKPAAAHFYSIGKNLRFVLDETVYEVYE